MARKGSPGTIVFAHANGFPSGTYRQLFEAWQAAGWRVAAPPMLAHDPAYPVSGNWPHLRDQLAAFVERESPGLRVALVGHSLGGYLSLLVACRRPELASAVVLIDSPVLTGWRAHSVQVLKATGLIGRVSPGRVSQTRRERWASVEEAKRHYATKSVFARWAPGVLDDYLAAGLEPHPEGGVTLAFKREIETKLYNTLPHTSGPLLRRHPPRCPVSFLGGTQSVEVRQVGLAATRAVTQGRIEWLEGSHLFPMEHPKAAAKAVLRLLAAPGSSKSFRS